jgi:hypothetical protein
MLRDISKQVQWSVNGVKTFMDAEDWKDVLTAALKRHQRVAEGIEGGFVFLGMRTSKAAKSEIVDLIELMYAFGSERGVKWTEPDVGP